MSKDFRAKISAELDTSKVEQQIKDIEKRKIKLGTDNSALDNELQKLRNKNLKITLDANGAIQNANSLNNTLKQALNIGSSAAIAAQAFRLIKAAINDAKSAIEDYNSAITDLRIVTNASQEQASSWLNTYNKMAQTLGATTSEVANAAVTWLRQGKTAEEANTLIKDSMMLSKIGMIDSEKAAENLTTAMKGYKVSVEDAVNIVDKLGKLDSTAAVTAGDLATGMSKTAATANDFGVSMDTLLGYLSAVGEVSGDVSATGTFLKTMFSRMSDIKSGKLELIDEDGTTEKLSDVETTLSNVGINLRETVTEFNNFEDVLDSLAEKYQDLNSVQQAALAKAFSGVRQQNNFRILMANYDKAKEYSNIASNSTGAAEEKFNAYLDSIEAKSKTLQSTFESLANNTISSELVNSIIDATTAVITFIDKSNILKGTLTGLVAVGAIKMFAKLATGISNATTRFNDFNAALQMSKSVNLTNAQIEQLSTLTSNLSKSQLKAVLSSKSLTKEQRLAILTNIGLSDAEAKTALSAMGLSVAEGTATTATFSLKGALKGLWATFMANPLVLVATAIAGVISVIATASQQANEAAQQVTQQAFDGIQTIKDTFNDIDSYKKKIKELKDSLNDSNLSQSEAADKRKELMQIQDELIKKYGEEKDTINIITDAINGQADALDRLSEKSVSSWASKNQGAMSGAEKYWTEDVTENIDGNSNGYGLFTFLENAKARNKMSKQTGVDIKLTDEGEFSEYTYDDIYSIKAANRKELIDKLNKLYKEIEDNGKQSYSLSDEEISNILTDISNRINYYNDNNSEDGNYNKQKEIANQTALYKIFTVKNDNGELKYKSLYDNINQAKEQYKKALESKNYNEVQAAKKAYEEVIQEIIDNTGEGKIIDDTTESGENIKMYFDSLNEEMQNIADGYKFIIKVNPDNIKSIINQSSKGSEQKTITKEDLDNLYLADIGENGLSRTETSMLDYSQEYIAAYNQIVKSAQDAGISVKDFIQELVNGGYLAENSASSYSSVSDIFTTYSDEITAVTSKAGKLKSAYSNLLKGSSSKSDVIALVQEFPKLASYVDLADSNFGNLAQGIQDISGEIANSLIQKLEDIDKSTLTEDEVKAYELLEEYLKNIGIQAQESLIWLQKIQSTISSVSSSLSSAYSMLNEITDENGNGMLSLSSIDTILTNNAFTSLRPYIDDMDKMQEALKGFIETQKDAYESLASQDLYESDYDKFKSEVDKKAETNSNFISDTIDEINNGINQIESTYNVDLTNWNNLSEDKKSLLANTNAELLVKQRGIIDKFKNTYNIDLTNYKNLEAAKTAIKAAAETQKRNELLETARLEAENKYTQSQLNDPLFGDIYRNSKENFLYWSTNSNSAKKEIKQAGEEALREAYSVFNAITLPDTNWSKILEGNSSNKNSSSSKQEFSKQFDWIEIAINKIKKVVSDLSSKVSNTYSNWSSRNSSLKKEIQSISKEINVQRNAYAAYMREANAVGLSSYWKNRVQNGTMDISTIKDERLAEQISSYQELYNKAMDCQDAIQELKQTMSSLYETSFNNVKSEFESKLNLIEHNINQYNDKITMIETNGYLKTVKYYNSLYNDTKNKITTLQSEYKSLTNQLNNAVNSGQIDKYSESWYSMNGQILDVKDSISQANIQLSEFAKTIRQIGWDNFDYLQERISQISNESNFLIDLMSNDKLYTDKGQFNKLGMATLGLRGQNYNVYMSQADQYYKELTAINKELSKDRYNTDLIERREKLLSLQQESIKAAEDEKNAIVDLVKNGIQAELDSLKELIDKYNDALDSAKNLYDYQNNISDKTSEIASLRKQLLAYSNDTSEETKATIQKLQVSLSDAEKDLKETEYDKYISDQKELLDNLYSDYEEILNKRLDNVDSLVNDMIGVINNNSNSISQTIKSEANSVGYHITANMQNIWNGSTNSVNGTISKYGNKFTEQLTAVNNILNSINSYVSSITSAGNSSSATNPKGNYSSTTSTNINSNSNAKKVTIGSKVSGKGVQLYGDYNGKYPQKQIHADDPIYIVTGEDNGYYRVRWYKSAQSVTSGWFKKSDVKAYKTGGLVDYTGLAQLDGTPDKPELVLNSSDTDNFIALRDTLRKMAEQPLIVKNSFPYFPNGLPKELVPKFTGITDVSTKFEALRNNERNTGTSIGDVTVNIPQINIPIDHVQDYEDFMNQISKDNQFEKMIQSMTVDRLAGKSKLAKNKYEW